MREEPVMGRFTWELLSKEIEEKELLPGGADTWAEARESARKMCYFLGERVR